MAEPVLRFEDHLLELRSESDRGLILITAAMLDELLGALLRSRLVRSASREDSLLEGPNAPLGAFSAKIDACHRLGLISSPLARDLHLTRRLRDELAHHLESVTFTDPAVSARVLELARSNGLVERSPKWKGTQEPFSTRDHFMATVVGMITALETTIAATATIEEPDREWLYTSSMDE